MPSIWDSHWGYIPAATGNAIVVGEWGGIYSGSDQQWLQAFASYLQTSGFTSQFFWCLNPDSGDTGGLLQNDWTTPEMNKLSLLSGLVSSPTKFSVNSAGQVCINGGIEPAASSSPAAASPSAVIHASPSALPSHSATSPAVSPLASPAFHSSPAPTGDVSFYTYELNSLSPTKSLMTTLTVARVPGGWP